MSIPFTMRLSVPANVLVQELRGEAVLLNLSSGCYFGLDEVGTRMWTALTTGTTIEAGCMTLQSEYDVSPETLRADVQSLLDKLVKHGLVEIHESAVG